MHRLLRAALDLRERSWKVRAGILAVATAGLLGVLALSSGSSVPTAAPGPAPATPATTSTTTVVATTVDAKTIQAAVAALESREGPTPQEVAAVPPTSHTTHHAKGGATHSHK